VVNRSRSLAGRTYRPDVIYQRPLAFLLGLEGVALLRGWAGDFGREYTEARIAEVRALLERPELAGAGVEATRVGTVDGYRVWAASYDQPGNGIFAFEEPIVHEILDARPAGVALDAACGTGRHSAWLAARGHRVIGVDSSPDMLGHARSRVPEGDFRLGDLHRLPVPDESADIVVCALALTHVPDLAPVITEFARVLRTGGDVVIADVHPEHVLLGSAPRVRSADGEPGVLPAYRHLASDYLSAALAVGLTVRGCAEPRTPAGETPPAGLGDVGAGSWDGWPWSLLDVVPAASAAAYGGAPVTIIWHFRK
jgi:SAM-dependent methyltransferase